MSDTTKKNLQNILQSKYNKDSKKHQNDMTAILTTRGEQEEWQKRMF